jgi:KDO2-lipid IV(A) lauroyltransferase
MSRPQPDRPMDERHIKPPPSIVTRALRRLEFGLLMVATGAVRAVPVAVASDAMAAMWRAIAPLLPRHARALDHLEHAFPELPAEKRRWIAREMWGNLGRVTAETIQLDRLVADTSRFEVTPAGLETLSRGRDGAVLVSLHMGNWEVVIQAANAAKLSSTGVYQTLRNPLVDDWLQALRAPLYPGGLLPKGSATARQMLGRVKRGQVVAVLGDLRESAGIQVPFFGRPAYANPFPAMAARIGGVPMIAGRVRRLEGTRFVIDAVEVPVSHTDDRIADVHATTAAMHAQFESWIREAPEQWMWAHRKWETKQAGRRSRRIAAAEARADASHIGPSEG